MDTVRGHPPWAKVVEEVVIDGVEYEILFGRKGRFRLLKLDEQLEEYCDGCPLSTENYIGWHELANGTRFPASTAEIIAILEYLSTRRVKDERRDG